MTANQEGHQESLDTVQVYLFCWESMQKRWRTMTPTVPLFPMARQARTLLQFMACSLCALPMTANAQPPSYQDTISWIRDAMQSSASEHTSEHSFNVRNIQFDSCKMSWVSENTVYHLGVNSNESRSAQVEVSLDFSAIPTDSIQDTSYSIDFPPSLTKTTCRTDPGHQYLCRTKVSWIRIPDTSMRTRLLTAFRHLSALCFKQPF